MELKIVKLYEDAIIPTRAYPTDSGLDLYAYIPEVNVVDIEGVGLKTRCIQLQPQEYLAIKTGIAISLPEPSSNFFVWEAQIRPKSGRALKEGLTVLNSPGTIDNSYTGEIIVIMYNAGTTPKVIRDGEKIAQLAITSVIVPQEIQIVSNLEASTDRGNKGFGSTGI